MKLITGKIDFLGIEKKIASNRIVWNLIFAIREKKFLVFISCFKTWLTPLFRAFCCSFFQLHSFLPFFQHLIFSTFFSVAFEKATWYYVSSFVIKFSNLIHLFSDILLLRRQLIERSMWFECQYYRKPFVACNHIIGIVSLRVVCDLSLRCKYSLFTRTLGITG